MQKAAVIAWLQSATKYSRIIVACMVSIDRMVTLLSATAAAGSPGNGQTTDWTVIYRDNWRAICRRIHPPNQPDLLTFGCFNQKWSGILPEPIHHKLTLTCSVSQLQASKFRFQFHWNRRLPLFRLGLLNNLSMVGKYHDVFENIKIWKMS